MHICSTFKCVYSKNGKIRKIFHVQTFLNTSPTKVLEDGSPTEYKIYMSTNVDIKILILVSQTTD